MTGRQWKDGKTSKWKSRKMERWTDGKIDRQMGCKDKQQTVKQVCHTLCPNRTTVIEFVLKISHSLLPLICMYICVCP